MVAKMTLGEIYKLCKLFVEVGCTRVKTNSGMNYKGETVLGVTEVEHIQFIKRNFPDIHIEASSGIFTMEKAKAVLEAGAENIHTVTWKACMGI
jgi:deoxyribose-phosphate aldolase